MRLLLFLILIFISSVQCLASGVNSSWLLWELGAFPRVLGRYSLRYVYSFEQTYLENESMIQSMRFSSLEGRPWNALFLRRPHLLPAHLDLLRKDGFLEQIESQEPRSQWRFLASQSNWDFGQKIGQGLFLGVFQRLNYQQRIGFGYRKITHEDPFAKSEDKGYFVSWIFKF